MAFNENEFQLLENKYGSYGSWAVWSDSKRQEKSTSVIRENLSDLNSRNILIGLNISADIDTWGNFRGGRHDRKLKYAFNNSFIRGAYMTDLFKNITEAKSNNIPKLLRQNPDIITRNVSMFIDEMRDLKISSATRFIVLGTEKSILAKYFKSHFQGFFPANPVMYHRHYSSRGTDKDWVESMWKALGIKADFQQVLMQYYS